MNKGLPERLEVAFSNLTLVTRPQVPKINLGLNIPNIKY